MLIVPLQKPKQVSFEFEVVNCKAGGWLIIVVNISEQPFASVIVTVYVSAERFPIF